MTLVRPSELHVQKTRAEALVTLTNGRSARGYFFVAGGSAHHEGPERVGDLLNAEDGFVPFERHDAGGAIGIVYNRRHLVVVALSDSEAVREPGYQVATRRTVSLLLSNGQRVTGCVRIYRPERQDRVSDWVRSGEPFRYIETDGCTLLVNLDHVVEVSEVDAQ